MPLYQYQALNKETQKKVSGYIESTSEREARRELREQKLMVTSLVEKKQAPSSQKLSGDSLLTFTIQLSQLIGAGVPLYESLMAIEEQYRTEPYHSLLLSLSNQVKSGTPLSKAMGQFPSSFSKLYRALVTAGESVGALDVVLERLSTLLTKQQKLKKEIVTAMIYPAVLASFSIVVVSLLLGFVVPSIEGIFSERKLNGFTLVVLTASRIFRGYWWLYIPLITGFVTYCIYILRRPAGKLWLERNMLKVPIINKLIIQTAVARFCRTMGTLLQGGLPLIDSLQISRDVMHNVVLEEEIRRAETKVLEGKSLSSELKRSKWFPTLVSRMLAVGEDSGSSVNMLNKLAEMYEDELEKSLQRSTQLAQPVILIIMGTVIGIILLAILLPLTDMSSLAL